MTQGRKTSLILTLTPEERHALKAWQRSTTIRAGLAKRARIILMLADGASITHITQTVDIGRRFVYKWAERYRKPGLTGLADKAGRGRKPFFPSGGSDASGQEGVRAA